MSSDPLEITGKHLPPRDHLDEFRFGIDNPNPRFLDYVKGRAAEVLRKENRYIEDSRLDGTEEREMLLSVAKENYRNICPNVGDLRGNESLAGTYQEEFDDYGRPVLIVSYYNGGGGILKLCDVYTYLKGGLITYYSQEIDSLPEKYRNKTEKALDGAPIGTKIHLITKGEIDWDTDEWGAKGDKRKQEIIGASIHYPNGAIRYIPYKLKSYYMHRV